MVTLYSFGSGFGLIDASPFVVKVDLFLRVAKLDYQVKSGVKYLRQSPKGKLPYITDDNQDIGDSTFIIDHLNKKYDVNIDGSLTQEQKATAHLFTRSLEENLYWCLVYSRWSVDSMWPMCKEEFFGEIPFPVKGIVSAFLRKGVIKNLHAQGIGRHSYSEVLSIADETLKALSHIIGHKNYFFGETISSFDITAYSILCQLLDVNYESDFNDLAKKYENLINFCSRIKSQYYAN